MPDCEPDQQLEVFNFCHAECWESKFKVLVYVLEMFGEAVQKACFVGIFRSSQKNTW